MRAARDLAKADLRICDAHSFPRWQRYIRPLEKRTSSIRLFMGATPSQRSNALNLVMSKNILRQSPCLRSLTLETSFGWPGVLKLMPALPLLSYLNVRKAKETVQIIVDQADQIQAVIAFAAGCCRLRWLQLGNHSIRNSPLDLYDLRPFLELTTLVLDNCVIDREAWHWHVEAHSARCSCPSASWSWADT